MSTAALSEIVRQRDKDLKQNVEDLAARNTPEAVAALVNRGKVIEIADERKRFAAIAQDYAKNPTATLVISPSNRERSELNSLIHTDRYYLLFPRAVVLDYVESGFPLFAAMHDKGHAIAVVGYDWRLPLNTGVPGMRYSWDEVKSLAVVDDSHLPYVSIPVTGGTLYNATDIDAFIVALPEKVFYPADAVDRLAPTLFRIGALVGLPPQDETIVRYFITTGSALRRFVRLHESEFDPKLVRAMMLLPFAQFIWIVEFSTEAQWATRQISARAVIDATASLVEFNPLWLFHGRRKALLFSREKVSLDPNTGIRALQMSDMGHAGFSRMDQNLRTP